MPIRPLVLGGLACAAASCLGAAAGAVPGVDLPGADLPSVNLPSVKVLPLSVAIEAVTEAVAACGKSGYLVAATVVDASGLVKAVAKGDGAPPHTLDTSRGKAYAAVSLGPNFRVDTTSAIVAKVGGSPAFVPLANLPGVFLVPGGVVIRAGGEVVGAVGVGGSPGGDKDEVCAQAAVAAVAGRLR